MTHQQAVFAMWFKPAQIARAFDCTVAVAKNSYCDRIPSGAANGGYGANLIDKYAGGAAGFRAREEAAELLYHVLPVRITSHGKDGDCACCEAALETEEVR